MAPEFKPGTFEPVVTVSPRSDGLTRAFHSDRQGLYDGCLDTIRVAFAASMAGGSNTPYNRSALPAISKIFAQYLWCRNLSNQLGELGLNNRYARELSQTFPLPEPIVKLFNCYGHVEHEEVKYVQLDLEREFCWSLIHLLEMVNGKDLDNDDLEIDTPEDPTWTQRLHLSTQGEVTVNLEQPVRVYVNQLIAHISGRNISPETRLRIVKNIIDVATERDLSAALRFLRSQTGLGNLPQRGSTTLTPEFRDRMKAIFGEHAPINNGDALDSKKINSTIRSVTEFLRRVVDELFIPFAVVTIPKYERGSLAQLSETIDDLTFTHFPLSLADLTVTAAFKVGRVLRRFLRASPEQTDDLLRGDLIRKSVRRRA